MKEVINYLDNLFSNKDTVVVATSGGPDSMCLLNIIASFKEKYNLNIICAHVNHGLRIESKEEAKFVKNFALLHNITFEYMVIDGYKFNKFTESEAREKRYNFFADLVKKYHAKYLFTAHHGDDLIETVLMRITRGSNLKGYSGINKITKGNKYTIVRPLLYVTKEDIISYLEENNIKYVNDLSNSDTKYTRNRFRKHMLPLLKKEDKNVHLKFLEFSEELEKTNNYINSLVDEYYKDIVDNNAINIDKLIKLDSFLQERIIERLIENIQKEYIFNISKAQFMNILLLINGNNKEINLTDNFIARKSYNKLYIEKNTKQDKYSFILNEDLDILNKFKFKFLNKSKEKSNYVLRLNSKEIKLPIIIRTRLDGDKIKVKNLLGSKKVNDIFIDSKVDTKKRSIYPIVTDSNNVVLWVPGIKKSIFDKDINEKYDIILKYVEEKNE